MRLLENAVVVIAGVLVLAIITVMLLAPDTVSRAFESISAINIAVRAIAMVVLNALVLVVIYLRIRRRGVPVEGLVVQAQGALANVEVESARAIVLDAVNGVPGVISTEAAIKAVRGRADIQMDVNIANTAVNIPQKQKEINRVLRQVINKQLGLRMHSRPRVNIRLEAPESSQRESVPAAAPVVNAAPAQPAPVPAAAKPPEAKPAPAAAEAQPEARPAENAGAPAPELSSAESSEAGLNDNWLSSYLRSGGDKESGKKTEQG